MYVRMCVCMYVRTMYVRMYNLLVRVNFIVLSVSLSLSLSLPIYLFICIY
jgi:hypothetical protein